MAALLDEQKQYTDELTGELINAGYIYVGTQSLDPKLNLIAIYSDRDLLVPIANPQRTGADGRAVNKIWVPDFYSLAVYDTNDVQKYIQLDNGSEDAYTNAEIDAKTIDKHYDTLALAITDVANLSAGDVVILAERTSGNGGGLTGDVITDTAGAASIAEGGYRLMYLGSDLTLELRVTSIPFNASTLFPKQWGPTGDGSTDDFGALQAVITHACLTDSEILFEAARDFYASSDTILITAPITIRGPYQRSLQQVGANDSTIVYTGAGGASTAVFKHDNATNDQKGATFIGMNLDGGSAENVILSRTVRTQVLDCVIRNATYGIRLKSGADVASGGTWNGEHRIKGCDIEGQATYGIYIEGSTILDSRIYDNWIYAYGEAGINFGTSATASGWEIEQNHIYPGSSKEISSGVPKTCININSKAAQFHLINNVLEGGTYLNATSQGTGIPIITGNTISLPDSTNQVGIDIDVAASQTITMIITDNSFYKNGADTSIGVKTSLADATATFIGKVTLNEYHSTVSTDESFDDAQGTGNEVGTLKINTTSLRSNADRIILQEFESSTYDVVTGTLDPESNITADRGSIYIRQSGVGRTLYLKETGTATNTGWASIHGDLTYFAANFNDATHLINADIKAIGLCVFDQTLGQPLWATGTSSTSTWDDATGATIYTPS